MSKSLQAFLDKVKQTRSVVHLSDARKDVFSETQNRILRLQDELCRSLAIVTLTTLHDEPEIVELNRDMIRAVHLARQHCLEKFVSISLLKKAFDDLMTSSIIPEMDDLSLLVQYAETYEGEEGAQRGGMRETVMPIVRFLVFFLLVSCLSIEARNSGMMTIDQSTTELRAFLADRTAATGESQNVNDILVSYDAERARTLQTVSGMVLKFFDGEPETGMEKLDRLIQEFNKDAKFFSRVGHFSCYEAMNDAFSENVFTSWKSFEEVVADKLALEAQRIIAQNSLFAGIWKKMESVAFGAAGEESVSTLMDSVTARHMRHVYHQHAHILCEQSFGIRIKRNGTELQVFGDKVPAESMIVFFETLADNIDREKENASESKLTMLNSLRQRLFVLTEMVKTTDSMVKNAALLNMETIFTMDELKDHLDDRASILRHWREPMLENKYFPRDFLDSHTKKEFIQSKTKIARLQHMNEQHERQLEKMSREHARNLTASDLQETLTSWNPYIDAAAESIRSISLSTGNFLRESSQGTSRQLVAVSEGVYRAVLDSLGQMLKDTLASSTLYYSFFIYISFTLVLKLTGWAAIGCLRLSRRVIGFLLNGTVHLFELVTHPFGLLFRKLGLMRASETDERPPSSRRPGVRNRLIGQMWRRGGGDDAMVLGGRSRARRRYRTQNAFARKSYHRRR